MKTSFISVLIAVILAVFATVMIIPSVGLVPASFAATTTPFSGSTCTSPNPSGSNCLTTIDNDFLWTSQTAFYAPAAPFGTWSATPEGCYDQPVPGTGICSTTPNGYANLGGSQDLGPITVSGNELVTSIAGSTATGNTITFIQQSNGNWITPTEQLTYTSPSMNEYWRGELYFGGNAPSQSTFVNGTLVQWDYISGPSNTQPAGYPDAIYDTSVGAWLVDFNVYLLESQCHSYSATSGVSTSCVIPTSYFGLSFPSSSGQLTSSAEPTVNPVVLNDFTFGGIPDPVTSIILPLPITPTTSGVPQFGIPAALVAAISMLGLVAMRRIGFGSRKVPI